MSNSKKEKNQKLVLWVARILSSQIALGIIAFVFVPGFFGNLSHNIPWLAFTTGNIILYGMFVVNVIVSWFYVRLGGIMLTGWGLGIIIFFISFKMWLMFFILGLPCLICGILFLLCWNTITKDIPENDEILNESVD
jgi:hypothetical protein